MILAVTLSTLFAGTSISNVDNRAYRYQNAPQVPVNPRTIFPYLASLPPDQLASLKNQYGGGGVEGLGLSGNVSSLNPLTAYLQTITNASRNLNEIGVVLANARGSLAIGDLKSVETDIRTLDSLVFETQTLLGSSSTTLDEISATYRVDTNTQVGKVRQLNEELQVYLLDINQLKVKASQTAFQPTVLSLNASLNQVLVEESFTAGGFLRWKQTPLSGRSITISWGSNNQSLTTNSTGGFQVQLSFPFGTPAGPGVVEAFYEPSANDSSVYQAAYSATQITVNYEQTLISARLDRSALKPSESAVIIGHLGTVTGQPLLGQLISVELNGLMIGNTTTVTNGTFGFILTIPTTMANGTYNVMLSFNPTAGQFAPATSTLPLQVVTFPSKMELKVDRALAFSGMSVTVVGAVTYLNGTGINRGPLAIYVDNVPYANTTTLSNGTFQYSIGLPIWVGFGSHSLTVKYLPADPWVSAAQTTTSVYVIDTPLFLFAAATLIGVPLASLAWLRRRKVPVSGLPPVAVPEVVVVERPRPVFRKVERYEESLSAIQAEKDSGLKVRKAYALAQTLIDTRLDEARGDSETVTEYYLRVTARLPQITEALKRLSGLFELADYSQFHISDDQANSALEALASIQDEIKT